MREILYRKRQSLKNHRKTVWIKELSEDKQCKTYVRKSFVYKVNLAEQPDARVDTPQIHIKKHIDTKKQQENFLFRVRGAFYMNQGRKAFKVDFCHTLKIDIFWKDKIFSPKKSATLT